MSRKILGAAAYLMLIPLCALPLTNCGKGGGSGGGGKKKQPNPGTLALDGLNGTIPKDVALSSPTGTISSQNLTTMRDAGVLSLPLAASLQPPPAQPGPAANDYLTKVKKLRDVLAATTIAECAEVMPTSISLPQGNFAHASCFGNNTRFATHPDVPGPYTQPQDADGYVVGDTGMMFDYADFGSDGQACSTQVLNNTMNNLGGYADTAIGMQALVACAGRLDGKDLPAVGDSIDMLPSLSGLSSADKPYSITTASISAETSGDKTVYVTSITGMVSDTARGLLDRDFTLKVYHVPQDEEAGTYKGVAQFTIKNFDPVTVAVEDAYISLSYDWTGTTLGYRYRQKVVNTTTTAFDTTTKELAVPSDVGPSTWTEITVQNDKYGFGKLAFSWITGDVIVFNATTSPNGIGKAYIGHKRASDALPGTAEFHTITGFKCYSRNPAPNGANAYTDYVQRQTLALNGTSGEWEMNSSNIQYVPTLNCNLASGSFEVFKEGQGGGSWETRTAPITNSLFPLSTYLSDWTPPTAPQVF